MQITWRASAFLLAILASTAGSFPVRRSTTGTATFYNPEGNLGACGNPIQDTDLAVALSSDTFAGGAHCGGSVSVQYNGVSLVATVVDLCPGCTPGGLDLTAGMFAQLADPDLGHIQVDWDFL
ncbi:Non-catalytic module family EXPN protein [Mycena belliarum]|uniref:Non-catalytic module family EXPN protein n=1 Tax=Mycena belliarum TaxID=1033014 RepID=A0AAD6TRA7_9AGAR|nr:Non-catalytic module family EXPN protein [Mycena belliae]